jgi:sec-independent protein translocase protein TatB
MFGLSTWEILIILAVALIFVGPDQLPRVARTIGKGVRQMRGAMSKVDDEMRKVVREASAELDDEGRPTAQKPFYPADHDTRAPRDAEHLPGQGRTRLPGKRRTMDERDQGPSPEADLAHAEPLETRTNAPRTSLAPPTAAHSARDWSQVGQGPVPGQVARGPGPTPASGPTPTPSPDPAPTPTPGPTPTSDPNA